MIKTFYDNLYISLPSLSLSEGGGFSNLNEKQWQLFHQMTLHYLLEDIKYLDQLLFKIDRVADIKNLT